ncbi:hypothetical protein F5Y17DRAFT_415556 [Xylariaceae sp. FL0594]|nr:hypothetical protein F5Y17DRAFT_415556 [Xylariaceae sp. FL0594]
MGWWDSLWASSTSADDPLRKLDPKLREFLERESPVKYSSGSKSQAPSTTANGTLGWATTPTSITTPAPNEADGAREKVGEPVVPPESQFQDGRYAHLWKTYRPLAEIEAETKTDHEKLMDVLEAYKERKARIGRAALENCALEQVDWRSCMSNPSFTQRMTMCRDQVKKFEKCYMTQTRLLKALGYLSNLESSPEVEEDIQMHADALYHRMLEQEAQIEEAKKEGRAVPKFAPLVPKPMATPGSAAESEIKLTPEQQEALRTRLEKVSEEDRAAEEEAFKGEIRAKAEVASRVQGLWRQQEIDRQLRKERGEETLWDRVAGVFGSVSGSSNSNSSNNNDNNNNHNNDSNNKAEKK